MFLCVSVNPAIDKRLCLPTLTRGAVNRATEVHPAPGGKSVHVALALKALGADPLWLGFAGGSNGDSLLRGLSEAAIRSVAVPIQKSSRMNLEILESDGTVTEILEPGPTISGSEAQCFLEKCEELFAQNAGAYVILSGSLPPGLSDDFYAGLIRRAHHHSCEALLDTSGTPLRRSIEVQPDLVKPNRDEAAWLTSSPIVDLPAAMVAILSLRRKGARSAAITLGNEGLVWLPAGGETIWFAKSPAVERRSAVGSGDCVLAALAYSREQGLGPEETLRLAAACGAANCLAESPGKLRREDVARLQQDVQVSMLHHCA